MSAEMELPPLVRMCGSILNTSEMTMTTAIVSPNARPRPSIVPPTIALLPNGSTTLRIIPQRVAPSAYAPSRSPSGAWPNASRMMEHAIGATISDTTSPAMNVDDVNAVAVDSGSLRSTPATLKIGIQPNQLEIHRDRGPTRHWRKTNPHRPYTTLGTAAIRSTIVMSVRCRRRGAYSEM